MLTFLRMLVAVAIASWPSILQAGVPDADHVRLECSALRLNVNDCAYRRQVRVAVTISASTDERLRHVEDSALTVINPAGQSVRLAPHEVTATPRRFKAAHAEILFRAVEDSDPAVTNVPRHFFDAGGPYKLRVDMRWESYRGRFSFAEPVSMRVTQGGKPIHLFTLEDELPLDIRTRPLKFGPVYYKRQDFTNFVFQLANIDDAIRGGDYHTEVESPRYFFQLRLGQGDEKPKLIDPSNYIDGLEPHLIRSEETSTPLHFPAEDFSAGQVVIIDFTREVTEPPDTAFKSSNPNFSSALVLRERVLYALGVEGPPENVPKVTGTADAEDE